MRIYHIECLLLGNDGQLLSVPAAVLAFSYKGALLKFIEKTKSLDNFPTIPMDTTFRCAKTASRRIIRYASDNPRIIVQITKEDWGGK